MKKISIQVTLTDESFYDWFIEPRQATGELPSLVLRLLTAYANNDELACQIDQYLDAQDNPEVYETRQQILDVLAQLNAMDARVDQELESIDGSDDSPASEDDDDDVDIVMSPSASAGGSAADSMGIISDGSGSILSGSGTTSSGLGATSSGAGFMPSSGDSTSDTGFGAPRSFSFTAESVVEDLSRRLAPVEPEVVAPVEAPRGTTVADSGFESKVFDAIGALTTQISQLTQTVSQAVTGGIFLGAVPSSSISQGNERATGEIDSPRVSDSPRVNASQVEDSVPAVEMPKQPVITPTVELRKPEPVVEKEPIAPVETASAQGTTEPQPSEDSDDVPDFIFGFMNSLGG